MSQNKNPLLNFFNQENMNQHSFKKSKLDKSFALVDITNSLKRDESLKISETTCDDILNQKLQNSSDEGDNEPVKVVKDRKAYTDRFSLAPQIKVVLPEMKMPRFSAIVPSTVVEQE